MTAPYKDNFLPGAIISSGDMNNNFNLLVNDIETYENLSSQIPAEPGNVLCINALNNFNPNTWPLIQVFQNGKKLIQGTGIAPLDFYVLGSQSISLTNYTAGDTVEIIYRKAV